MKKKAICIAAAVLVAGCAIFSAVAPADQKYVFAIPMIEGFEQTSFVQVFQKMGVVFSQKIGSPMVVKNLVFKNGDRLIDLVRKEFKNGTSDISYINGIEYGDYVRDGGKDLTLLFTLTMNNNTIDKTCFFTRKGEFKNVADLRGRKYAGAQPVMSRYLLYKNGINEPNAKFFSSIDYEPDSPIKGLLQRLYSKDIDVFATYMHTVWLSGDLNRKEANIAPLYCEDYESMWVFVARNDMPQDVVAKFRNAALNAYNDKDFAQFQFAFKMVKGRFAPLDDKAIDLDVKTSELIEKNGWHKEEAEFFKKYYRPPAKKQK
jgi:hypothetical protein